LTISPSALSRSSCPWRYRWRSSPRTTPSWPPQTAEPDFLFRCYSDPETVGGLTLTWSSCHMRG
jgi:hypothetical protein